MYAERPQEMRDKLQITREQVLKLETAVCGLRNAPGAWWKRVVRDLTETGWVQHQLDQCTFMFLNGTELVGLVGVHVGWMRRRSRLLSCSVENSKEHFHGERGNEDNFTLTGIEIEDTSRRWLSFATAKNLWINWN